MDYVTTMEKYRQIQKTLNNQLYAVCSGTKADGKTWLATSICHQLGLMKKKTLFFDADCGFENISGQLGLDYCTSYNRLLNGNRPLNNAVFHFDKGCFDIVCSFPGENRLNTAPAGRMQLLAGDLAYLSKVYDYVFIDCAADEENSINPFFNICGNVIVLANAESVSLTTAYHQLEKIKKTASRAKINIVINRAISFEEGAQTFKTLLKAAEEYIKVDLNLLGIIRQDSRIREAVVNQSLLLNRYPACEGAKDVEAIVRQIVTGA